MNTPRLFIREQTKQLLDQVLSQPAGEQMKFFGLTDEKQLQVELAKMEKRRANGNATSKKWDLIEQSDQKVIGSCGFHNWSVEHERAELGYQLQASYRGKGYMLEALEAIIPYGFHEMKLNRIEALMDPYNDASRRIVEKLGFKREGVLREHYKSEGKIHDSVVYALLRSEYQKK